MVMIFTIKENGIQREATKDSNFDNQMVCRVLGATLETITQCKQVINYDMRSRNQQEESKEQQGEDSERLELSEREINAYLQRIISSSVKDLEKYPEKLRDLARKLPPLTAQDYQVACPMVLEALKEEAQDKANALYEELQTNGNTLKVTTTATEGVAGHVYTLHLDENGKLWIINSLQNGEDLEQQSWIRYLKAAHDGEMELVTKNRQQGDSGCIFAACITELMLRSGVKVANLPEEMDQTLETKLATLTYLALRPIYSDDKLEELNFNITLPAWVFGNNPTQDELQANIALVATDQDIDIIADCYKRLNDFIHATHPLPSTPAVPAEENTNPIFSNGSLIAIGVLGAAAVAAWMFLGLPATIAIVGAVLIASSLAEATTHCFSYALSSCNSPSQTR